ncbi:hypothetical protein DFH08DRAFT_799398 [Mycena albidolilacea]|uniref:Uncharacterized protein n=1 Tax=Mycena albidolilacea TaxID=1033008 RepID=A0AAD7F1W4_9AGAR|nr:hypothetical protein DFH08DRAFT_799398 [Mycena albidolilacea]
MIKRVIVSADSIIQYPVDLVPVTIMDENGRISLKQDNGRVVGYNPTLSRSFQCNTDLKFIGSGPLAMALSIYMTLYTINGRRELSGQQVACSLLGIGNHLMDAQFAVFYWSKSLTWLSDNEFPPYAKKTVDPTPSLDKPEEEAQEEASWEEISREETSHLEETDSEEHTHDNLVNLVDLEDSMVLLNEQAIPMLNSLVYDILFRLTELEDIPMWDQCVGYEKVQLSKGKESVQVDDDMDDIDDNNVLGLCHP